MDTMKLIFSTDRFLMNKMYREEDPEAVKDPRRILKFVNETLNGEIPYFFETENPKKPKFSSKLCGEDIEKRVFDSSRDSLVLIYHPLEHKNRGLKDKFESLAEHYNGSVLLGRYSGVNESAVFKCPKKLPALVYFKKADDE